MKLPDCQYFSLYRKWFEIQLLFCLHIYLFIGKIWTIQFSLYFLWMPWILLALLLVFLICKQLCHYADVVQYAIFICVLQAHFEINREYYWYSSYSHMHGLQWADCPAQSFSDFRLRELCITLTVSLAPNLFLMFDLLIFLVKLFVQAL